MVPRLLYDGRDERKMGKKIVSRITLILFLVGAITSMLSIQSAKSETKTWIVDDDGPADFNRIQDAINNASVQVETQYSSRMERTTST